MMNFTVSDRSGKIARIQDAIFAAYVFLFAVGCVNFLLLLMSTVRRLTQDAVTNIYVTNLSIAGVTLVCSVPMTLVYLIKRTWLLGRWMCIVYWIMEQSNKYSSILFLTVLCVDRYLVVAHPLTSKRYRVRRYAYCVAIASWIAVLIFLFPVYLYANSIEIGNGRTICVIYWPLPSVNSSSSSSLWTPEVSHTVASFFLIFAVPCIANIALYARVLIILRKLGTRSLCRSSRRTPKYKRTTMTILTVIICYVLCWAPYWLHSLCGMLGLIRSHSLAMMISQNFILMLPYVNAAVNPMLLIASSPAFDTQIAKIRQCFRRTGYSRTTKPQLRVQLQTANGATLKQLNVLPDESEVLL